MDKKIIIIIGMGILLLVCAIFIAYNLFFIPYINKIRAQTAEAIRIQTAEAIMGEIILQLQQQGYVQIQTPEGSIILVPATQGGGE